MHFCDGSCSDICQSKVKEREDKWNNEKVNCAKCQKPCPRKELVPKTVEGAENGYQEWCYDCAIGKDKPTDHQDNEPTSNELCERCSNKERYWTVKWYSVNFTKETHWFGKDCSCLVDWKNEHQQTCPHCQKREWPDMKKGWLLDYEIKMAFCSPMCHVEYRQMKWEEAQRLTQVEMTSPELEIRNSNNQSNFNWEQESSRREVLFWREYARELEQRLSNQTNLTPEERQQSNYLRNLQQNTLRNAENNYQSRYGNLTEDSDPKKNKKNKPSNSDDKGIGGGMIALLIIGGVILIGGIILLLTRKNKKIK